MNDRMTKEELLRLASLVGTDSRFAKANFINAVDQWTRQENVNDMQVDSLDVKSRVTSKASKPTPDTKGVRQVRDVVFKVHCAGGNGYYQDEVDKAVAALQEIMLGMLPEEKPDNWTGYWAYKDGWDGAIKDMEQNIRGGFKA